MMGLYMDICKNVSYCMYNYQPINHSTLYTRCRSICTRDDWTRQHWKDYWCNRKHLFGAIVGVAIGGPLGLLFGGVKGIVSWLVWEVIWDLIFKIIRIFL